MVAFCRENLGNMLESGQVREGKMGPVRPWTRSIAKLVASDTIEIE